MTSCEVRANGRSYRAHVGTGLLPQLVSLLPAGFRNRRCAVICDTNSKPFAEEIASEFGQETRMVIPAGEQSKSLEQVGAICDEMIAAGLDRNSFVIGVGGGVVGDVSGFVAAIFQRGIPHVQVPTTLLAMVDSSIGGKTGVNTRAGKNLIGAIHQPSLIIADLETLRTLPEREFKQGFAEIIKHGIIRDAEMLEELQQAQSSRAQRSGVEGPRGGIGGSKGEADEAGSHTFSSATGSLGYARDDLESLVARNIEIKAAIVAADERETSGERAVLNFGHTIGHAIERAAGYGTLLHGEAVSLGMVAACRVSIRTAGFSETSFNDVVALLRSFDLPTTLPAEIDREEIAAAVHFDKKFEGGRVLFVVTPRLGEAYLSSAVTLNDIRGAIAQL